MQLGPSPLDNWCPSKEIRTGQILSVLSDNWGTGRSQPSIEGSQRGLSLEECGALPETCPTLTIDLFSYGFFL